MEVQGNSETSMSNASLVSINIIKEEPSDQSITPGVSTPANKQVLPLLPAIYAMSTDNNPDDDEKAECTTEHGRESVIKNNLSKCILCGKAFVTEDNPKLLECLHAACTSCITSKLQDQHTSVDAEILTENNIILCKTCNVTSQLENMIENRFFSKFLEADLNNTCDDDPKDIIEERKCTNCTENAVATSWCVECEELICQNCVMAHQRLKITKDHTIKPKEEIANDTENIKKGERKPPVYLFCTLHSHEQLSLFCQTCDRLTCRDCQLSEHREHKYKFIHEIAAETQTSVRTLLGEVSYKRELLKSAMKVIQDRQVLISEKKKHLVQEITQSVVQLTNAVSTRGKQLIMRLSEVCDQKQTTLNEKKVALDQLSKLTDHCIDFVNYALDKGTDMELLYSKKSITNHLQRIKSRRADIPNPEIPVRIHLTMEKMQDLIKVISSIGAIVVDGRVYPSVTPPSESSAPTTPLGEVVEPKHLNPCAVNAGMECVTVSQPVSHLSNQLHSSISHNTYVNKPMNIPITSQQITMSTQQHVVNQQQIQSQAQVQPQAPNFMQHYNAHNMQQRASPQNQRLQNFNTNYNGRMQSQQQQQQQHQQQQHQQHQQQHQQHQQHQQQQQQQPQPQSQQQHMMMAQRPGLGNCHQQVTSSTHPHQQKLHNAAPSDSHLNNNDSLRGLLFLYPDQNPPAYRPTANTAQYRFPPRYQYPMNNPQRPIGPPQNYQSGTSLLTGMQVRPPPQPNQQLMLNTYQQHPQAQQMQSLQSARWHIPQNMNATAPYFSRSPMPQQASNIIPTNDTYKITLKNQPAVSAAVAQAKTNNVESPPVINQPLTVTQNPAMVSQTVSSSTPKTPSPAPHEKTDETHKNLDKFCQKSLNDLMLTIAKLDSNGIVVIPETQKNQLDSAQVDSSTDEAATAAAENSSATAMAKDDPNEDWCAVCMDGGDAVLCCDKCPKVFHLYCHIPSLKSFPHESETWQCMLCTNVLDCSEDPPEGKNLNRLSTRDLRIAQRILLELYCQYEQSLAFREVIPPEIVEYHRVIKKPMSLDIIKEKLKPENENHYVDLKQVMYDIRLIFKNAFVYNPIRLVKEDTQSQIYHDARSLEEFFEKLLLKWAPTYAYDDPFLNAEGEEDEDVFPPNRKYRRIITD